MEDAQRRRKRNMLESCRNSVSWRRGIQASNHHFTRGGQQNSSSKATKSDFARLVLRWKETDSGHVAKARWCVHEFKDPDIHKIERSCPLQKWRPSMYWCKFLPQPNPREPWPTARKLSCRDTGAYDEDHFMLNFHQMSCQTYRTGR